MGFWRITFQKLHRANPVFASLNRPFRERVFCYHKTMKRHRAKAAKKTAIIEITAKEFRQHTKNQFWYIGVSLMLLAFIYLTIVSQDYLMTAVVVAVGIAIFRLHNLRPGTKRVRLATSGVHWGDRFFAYHQLRAFWLATTGGQITIYLERLNLAAPISFVVPTYQAEPVIDYLTHHLPWHSHRYEPLSERLSRLLKL